ncbi:MAG: carboxypeptidase-like regulatory domain-containing protein [Longimicrobiales bacterium]
MFRSSIRWIRWVLASLAVAGSILPVYPGTPLPAQQVLPGRIVGRVVDQDKGDPVEGAELRIRGTAVYGVSDRLGKFELEGVPAGGRVLEVSHLSYRVRTDSLQVLPEQTLEVTVMLSPDPLLLEPLVVSVRSKVLEASGFYLRREQGLSGVLLTREQIEERNPARFTDLFVSIPGARIAHRDGVGGSVVVFPRGNLMDGETCFPDVWVDGIITTIVDLDQFNPDQVEGLEVYQGAGTPLRYNSPCGAILIWTHVPVKGRY